MKLQISHAAAAVAAACAALTLAACWNGCLAEESISRSCLVQHLTECQFLETTAGLGPDSDEQARRRTAQQPVLLVLIGGLVGRLYPETTWQHVVAPAVRDGYIVDVAVILTVDVSGFDAFTAYWYDPRPNPRFANATVKDIRYVLMQGARQAGARRVSINILERDVEIQPLPPWVIGNRRMLQTAWHGISAEDNRFTAAPVFWNFLTRMKKVEMLWNWTASHRPDLRYDHVVWTRSDAIWLHDLRMEHFPHRWKIYSRPEGQLCGPSTPATINDQTMVLGGLVASVLLTGYSSFYKKNRLLDQSIDPESFLFNLARVARVPWVFMQPEFLPFALGLHMPKPAAMGNSKDGEQEVVFCLRESANRSFSRESMRYCEDLSSVAPFTCDQLVVANFHTTAKYGIHLDQQKV